MKIDMEGFTVTLTRKRIKNCHCRIHPSGEVRVSAPMRLSLDVITRFLNEKRGWIEGHRTRLLARPVPQSLQLESGEFFYFLGERYTLWIDENDSIHQIDRYQNQLIMRIKPQTPLEQKQVFLNQWIRHQMQALLPQLIEKWEAVIGVHADEWRIKSMKTRWGSCHPLKKRICLNLRLMEKPVGCLESVIVHELVHLLEASHNARFYALMTQFMPEWRTYKCQLL